MQRNVLRALITSLTCLSPIAEEGGWTPCTEGALSSTIQRSRTKQRQANLLRMGASTLAGVVVLLVASIYFSPDSVELECYKVAGLLSEYASGGLDEESRQVVEEHLVSCEKCRMKLNEMKAGEMTAQTVSALPPPVFQREFLLSSIKPMPLPTDR